jgi:branched-chain amino acid transport system permease protein
MVDSVQARRSRIRRRRRRLSIKISPSFVNVLLAAIVIGGGGILVLPRALPLGAPFFIQILIFGLGNGAIYALVALGYTMVYGIIELINFAHGDVFTLGAMISLTLMSLFGVSSVQQFDVRIAALMVAILVIVMLIVGVINVAIERVAYRPMRNAPKQSVLITAVGVSFILEGIMYLWKGPDILAYPNLLPEGQIAIGGGVAIQIKDLVVITISVFLVVALTIFVNRSRLGRAMRATAQNRNAAQLMGINVDFTISATFFIGALLAGAGGMMFGLYYNYVNFQLGFTAGLIAFTAAVLGGIGNIRGAAIGGLCIGLVRALMDGYFSSAWTDVVIFAVLIFVLVFKPNGLLGMRVPEK